MYKYLAACLASIFFSISLEASVLTVLVGMEPEALEGRWLGCLWKRQCQDWVVVDCAHFAQDLGLALDLRFGASLSDLWEARHDPEIRGLLVIGHATYSKERGSVLHDAAGIDVVEVLMGSYCDSLAFIGIVGCHGEEIAAEFATVTKQGIPCYGSPSSREGLTEVLTGVGQVCSKIFTDFEDRLPLRMEASSDRAYWSVVDFVAIKNASSYPLLQVTDGQEIVMIIPAIAVTEGESTFSRCHYPMRRYLSQLQTAKSLTFRALPLYRGHMLNEDDFSLHVEPAKWKLLHKTGKPCKQLTFVRIADSDSTLD